MYIGTQTNIGLTGAPPLIAPAPGITEPQPTVQPGGEIAPGAPAGGVPGPPIAAPPGAQPLNPATPLAPGTSRTPGPTLPATPTAPPAAPPTTPPTTAPETMPAAGAAPTVPATGQPAAPAATPSTTPAQVIVTPPGTEFRVAGGPYTVPVSINNASRLSAVTLTVTYNPAVLRVRTVQDGTFMRQGGVTASFTPHIDANTGRVDIAVARSGDQTGASGAGLLAALMFDAIAPGSSTISVSGVGTTPDGAPVAISFSPVTITVR
jgi:hypothetical protein